ncbi:MAG: MATE family efflux transporter [Clostridia bacterium]|nr:MATE family efflux transporter [Clostridia bacterium]
MDKEKQKRLIMGETMWKVVFKLSWPAIVAMVFYGMNTVFDAIFVGRYVGETALAGVSLAYPLTQITLGFGSLIGVGAGSALSIAIGENDRVTEQRLLGNANYLSVIMTILFMVAGLSFAEPWIRMMGGEGMALVYGVSYFKVTVYGTFFWIVGLAGNMLVRAEGKMKSAAVMMALGLIVNIVSNYLLIVILDMGVEGAAIGTNIGMFVYTLAALVYFGRHMATFDAQPFSIVRDADIIKKILSMGIPSLIMTVMTLLQAVVVLNALSTYGTTSDIAFYGIVYRLFTFMLTPIFGLMRALQPVVGINFGARQYERVISSVKVFAICATLLLLPFWVVMMVSPSIPLMMMLPGHGFSSFEVANFRWFMGLLPILPIIFMGMTFFPAVDQGKYASIMGIVRQLVFYVPVMLIMPRYFGIHWVYLGSFVIDLLMIIWTATLMKKSFNTLRKSGDYAMEGVIQ